MLSFTQHQKSTQYNINQLDFQPLVISNKNPSALPLAKNPQKKITKTINTGIEKERQTSKGDLRRSREKAPQAISQRGEWKDGGKIQMFDRNIRKNQLAEEQRRIRAQAKKKQLDGIEEIVKIEKDIRGRAIKLEKEEENEINKLRRMIEKEKEESERNARLYEIKMKEIQKERDQLLLLERKIQENGVKNQKQFKKQIKVLTKNQYPANDRGKCHQDQRQPARIDQPTQSQTNHQYNALRQHQLQLLTQQRQKSLKAQPSLNYNPTIIPLLSKASYKIISTHISTLVELFVDELLEEEVYMLQEIQMREKAAQEESRSKEMINDYYQQLSEFVGEAEEIESRVGRYNTLKFSDLYIPKKYEKTRTNLSFKPYEERQCLLQGLNEQVAEQIESRRDRTCRFFNQYDHYKKANLNMFAQATQELIDQAIFRLAKELDRGSNDFVQLIFRKEFQ